MTESSGTKGSRAALIVIIVLSLAVAGAVAALGVHLARNHFERYPPGAEAAFLTQCERTGSAQLCEPRDDGHRPVPGITGVSNDGSLGVAQNTFPSLSTTLT